MGWNYQNLGENNQTLHSLSRSGQPVTCGAITIDGGTLAVGGKDGAIETLEHVYGELLVTLKASDEAILSLAFDKSGESLLATDKSNVIRCWNVISHRAKEIIASENAPFALLSPDGNSVVFFPHNGQSGANSNLSTSSATYALLSSGKAVCPPSSVGVERDLFQ